jgi:L-threonylcarbamoyladenylate synthase
VDILRAGGLVAFPTETVYGLGADASNTSAVTRIFEVKGRPSGHPLIVHLPAAGVLDDWARSIPEDARRLADAFWPGPLTLLLDRRPERVPDVVTGGRPRVGLRVPAHPLGLELLEAFAGAIAAPSANRFGRVSPTTAAHVIDDLGADVDLVLDGGATDVGVESTIVDFATGEPEVVRPGGVTFEELERVLGRPVGVWLGDRAVEAPGTLEAHYAPAARLVIVDDPDHVAPAAAAALGDGLTVVVLAPRLIDALPTGVRQLEPAGDEQSYARVLYDRLREADRDRADLLLVVPPSDREIGRAVRDRLRRAARSD